MLITIPSVLTASEIARFRQQLATASWQDGRTTAGSIATQVKRNQQLDDGQKVVQSLGRDILLRLSQHATFISAAIPDRIYPPKFNRYTGGQAYGQHVDAALMQIPDSPQTLRTDLSATLFLSDPEDYIGGELQIQTQFGQQSVKLAAGDMVLYPASSLHAVTPVIEGERVAAFFWIQSMVRECAQREMLYELDQSIQQLSHELGSGHHEVARLSGIYHNLIRRWASPT